MQYKCYYQKYNVITKINDILNILAVVRRPGGGGSDEMWSCFGSGALITSRAEFRNDDESKNRNNIHRHREHTIPY